MAGARALLQVRSGAFVVSVHDVKLLPLVLRDLADAGGE